MSSEALERGAAIRKVLLSPGSHPERDPKECDGCKAESELDALLAEVARLEQERDDWRRWAETVETPYVEELRAALAVARERAEKAEQELRVAEAALDEALQKIGADREQRWSMRRRLDLAEERLKRYEQSLEAYVHAPVGSILDCEPRAAADEPGETP